MKKFFILLTVVLLSACSYQRFKFSESQPTSYPYETKSIFFVSGIGQTDNIDVKKICGSYEVQAVETSYSFVDGVLGLFTYGLFTPKSYKVWCKPQQ